MPADARETALRHWLQQRSIALAGELTIASADASARRYFRVPTPAGTRIAMDAPPEREDTAAFVDIAQRLADAGIHVPRIEAHDRAGGFVLMSDMGDTAYIDRLGEADGPALMDAAVDTLVRMQADTPSADLPPYDAGRLRAELELFPRWYVRAHLGIEPGADWWRRWQALREDLIERALAQPHVFVHRDYMARNLMVTTPCPGVLDFQDAVHGPITYDLASLLRDAFASWDARREQGWIARYRRGAQAAGLPVPGDAETFEQMLATMAAQRHLKVLGIFARLYHRDGKPRYIGDAARFLGYLRAEAAAVPALQPMTELLAALGTEVAP